MRKDRNLELTMSADWLLPVLERVARDAASPVAPWEEVAQAGR